MRQKWSPATSTVALHPPLLAESLLQRLLSLGPTRLHLVLRGTRPGGRPGLGELGKLRLRVGRKQRFLLLVCLQEVRDILYQVVLWLPRGIGNGISSPLHQVPAALAGLLGIDQAVSENSLHEVLLLTIHQHRSRTSDRLSAIVFPGFQHRGMKHVVHGAQLRWQQQSVVDWADTLKNCEGTQPSRLELAGPLHPEVLGIQKNTITHRKGSILSMLVGVLGVTLLRQNQLLASHL